MRVPRAPTADADEVRGISPYRRRVVSGSNGRAGERSRRSSGGRSLRPLAVGGPPVHGGYAETLARVGEMLARFTGDLPTSGLPARVMEGVLSANGAHRISEDPATRPGTLDATRATDACRTDPRVES